ncbi:hypothetical protein EXIGLDRAFT_781138 [Exidia glandulosa HHB12029]|uniref:Uncharacterized protein n=1 Tax=Exidia glandulosa HHB12029 TaxID=1314781 RepID=A0A165BC95_EXIGL|nr:hypothetical protein EXIGLDRAFT_781138 [Exidia glandulosa HHB12029]
MLTLPSELSLLVLEQAAGTDAHDARAYSHVNQRWRRLALGTPSLWTVLDSRLGPSAARIYLERSKERSLDIRVVQRGIEFDEASYYRSLDDFFAVAFHHAPRWSRFTIDASLTRAVELVTNLIANVFVSQRFEPLPILDAVTFRVNPNIAHDLKQEPEPYQQMREALFLTRSLTLGAVPAWEERYFTSLLTTLHLLDFEGRGSLRAPDLAHLTRVLSRTPNLQELLLDASGPSSTRNVASQVQAADVEMQYLSTLTICSTQAVLIPPFLSLLRMPVLRVLHLNLRGTGGVILSALRALPRTTPLVELRIATSDPPPSVPALQWPPELPSRRRKKVPKPDPVVTWQEALSFQELELLSTDGIGLDNDALECLAALPKLGRLELRSEHLIDADNLRSLLHRRLEEPNVSAIRHLEVALCKGLDDAAKDTLRPLVPTFAWLSAEETDDEDDDEFEADNTDDEEDYSDSDPDIAWDEGPSGR